MKWPLIALALAALAGSADGAPRHKRSRAHQARLHQGRARSARSQTAAPADRDELELSPSLIRKLQANLFDGGYLRGTLDGRLTARTRRALAAFQREYHLKANGQLDRATAEALLGTDVIGAYLATRD